MCNVNVEVEPDMLTYDRLSMMVTAGPVTVEMTCDVGVLSKDLLSLRDGTELVCVAVSSWDTKIMENARLVEVTVGSTALPDELMDSKVADSIPEPVVEAGMTEAV